MNKQTGISYSHLVWRGRCRHRWSPWTGAQLAPGHERRDCELCDWIQTRRRPSPDRLVAEVRRVFPAR
jgi:hypothetical protein